MKPDTYHAPLGPEPESRRLEPRFEPYEDNEPVWMVCHGCRQATRFTGKRFLPRRHWCGGEMSEAPEGGTQSYDELRREM